MKTWLKEELKESLRLYLSYVAVGVGAIPAGICYATYSAFHGEHTWAAILAIAVGMVCGGFAARWTYKRAKVWVL